MKKNNETVEGPDGLVYTARLPLSSATLNYLADLIRGHCKKNRSPWRALPAGKIAGIVLAVLRCDQRPGDLAGGNRPLTPGQKLSNTVLAAVRAPVEHGFAHLKNWRVLTKLRTDPKSATVLVRALLVLTNREIAR
ncbi:transposase family protein [Streptomyces sporangiiformans]|uniref:Transposase family protein n=1 Tax=Streptomyces sporangiiformans TaxID=2315329 RepID=A0A505DIA7_9ACTN|nr:transposase family protein [Streptomyces sporangiiformans]TPQ18976.1 transposase family protein [Streptomyces sporangiiformans]